MMISFPSSVEIMDRGTMNWIILFYFLSFLKRREKRGYKGEANWYLLMLLVMALSNEDHGWDWGLLARACVCVDVRCLLLLIWRPGRCCSVRPRSVRVIDARLIIGSWRRAETKLVAASVLFKPSLGSLSSSMWLWKRNGLRFFYLL
jgi:hypothetical protein